VVPFSFSSTPAVTPGRNEAVVYYTVWDVACYPGNLETCSWVRISGGATVVHLRKQEETWVVVQKDEIWSVN
jgi:hypothetical protein